jgi:hypothetical protein
MGAGSPYMPMTSAGVGSGASSASGVCSAPDLTTDPVDWLMAYTKMTPASRCRPAC